MMTAQADDDNITWYYTFDNNGNLIRQSPGSEADNDGATRYSYDAANRLIQVELYSSGSYTLLSEAAYNGDGDRVSLTTYALGTPQTVNYVNAEGGQLLVADDGSQTTLYLHGQTQLAEYNGDWTYPLRDSSSSSRQTVDASGTVISAQAYKPFGATLAESGVYESAFGFLGSQVDRLSGLLYGDGRYYDPATGRYLTPNHNFDPLRPGTHNPYAPQQGPWWLLLPLLGIIAWRGRKDGTGRILVLLCIMGLSTLLTSCGGQPIVDPPTPQPPTQPTSQPTGSQTPTQTPTYTPTSPPPPQSTSTSTPLPPTTTPCPPTPTASPTPTGTPTPLNNDPDVIDALVRVLWREQRGQISDFVAGAAWVIRNRVEFSTDSSNYDTSNYNTMRFADAPWDNYIDGISADAATGALGYFAGNWDSELSSQLREQEYNRLTTITRQVLSDQHPDPTNGALFFANISKERYQDNFEQCVEIYRERISANNYSYGEIEGFESYFFYSSDGSTPVPSLSECEE